MTEANVKAKDHGSYITFTILSVVIPFVGFILGIVYLAKDKKVDKKLGEHTLAFSVIFGIFWWILFAMFVPSSTTTLNTPSNSQNASDNLQVTENKPLEEKKPDVPVEYLSALAKAKIYSDTQHMSKQGLYDQLTSEYGEKFSKEAAQYAIDNLNADYKANALAKAKVYQNDLNMSPAAIHDQLTSEYGEKFTKAEADYAIAHLND